jgi:hypothetical protein
MSRTIFFEPFTFEQIKAMGPAVGYATIRSRQGLVGCSAIDIEDQAQVSRESWHLAGSDKRMYVRSGSCVMLHRFLLGLRKGDGKACDHINGNQFYNRRSNLRVCSHSENMHNKTAMSHSATGIRGVSWNPGGYWCASMNLRGKRVLNAFFKTKEEAIAARLKAEADHGVRTLRHDESRREQVSA